MPTILIIEDEEQLRGLLRTVLEAAGYHVQEASHGREGLEAVRFCPPDLVLSDIFMAEQDGLATILSLRREFPEVKVIAMSGGGTVIREGFLDEARALGAVATLKKPFSPDALLQAVSAALTP